LKNHTKLLQLVVISLGFTSVITQIILLREFLKIFYGNELIVGIVLSNWMLLTGLGAFLGKLLNKFEISIKRIFWFQLIISFLPALTLIILKSVRYIFFPYGALLSIVDIYLYSFVLLVPFCVLSGLLFTFFCKLFYSLHNDNHINKIYFLDIVGSIIGGIIFNIFLVFFLKPFQSFVLLMIINFFVALFLSLILNKKAIGFILILIIFLILIVISFIDIDKISEKKIYKNQLIVESSDNYLGNICVTKTEEQYNFFENGMLLFSSNDKISCEESVHYAMVQHKKPKKVLLISGGVSGAINEIIKYKPQKIDYIEINPYIFELGKKYIKQNYNYNGLKIINKDPYIFLNKCNNKYDIVLINLSEPSTAQINRYYSIEFFKLIKSKSEKDVIISTCLPLTENYISKSEANLNSVLYCTLNKVFKNILIIPGAKNYFIVSDSALSYNIAELINKREIGNNYVNEYYIDDNLVAERGNYILKSLDKNADINTCFKPISYYYQLIQWLSYFKINYYFLIILIILIFFVIISRLNYIDFAMFAGGFSAISAEIILIIGFQIIYGYVFQMLGIIITIFMIGLALGSYFISKKINSNLKNFIIVQFLISLYFVILPLFLLFIKNYFYNELIINFLIILSTLSISTIIGLEFSISTRLRTGNILLKAGTLYSSDLFGSAFGALIISAILIPLIGTTYVCFVIAVINIISILFCVLRGKSLVRN